MGRFWIWVQDVLLSRKRMNKAYNELRVERDNWQKLYEKERANNGGLFRENERIKAVLRDQLNGTK